MCRSVAIVRPIALPSSHTRIGRIVGVTASGLGVALVGLTAFGLAHALIIVPIWTRLLGGVPFAVGAGLALAWAFDELARHRGSQSIASGVQFGAVMFLTLIPATALEAAMRWFGLRTLDWAEVIPAVALALLSGAIAGWLLTRRGRPHEDVKKSPQRKGREDRKEESFENMLCALCDLCVQRDSFTTSSGLPARQAS